MSGFVTSEQKAAAAAKARADKRRRAEEAIAEQRRELEELVGLLPKILPVWKHFARTRRMKLGPVRKSGISLTRAPRLSFVLSPSWLWLRRYSFELFLHTDGSLDITQPDNWSGRKARERADDLGQALADATGRDVWLFYHDGSTDPELGGRYIFHEVFKPQQKNGED